MNIPFIIETIHERRQGLDMITKGYDQATHFASRVKRRRESTGDKGGKGGGITR